MPSIAYRKRCTRRTALKSSRRCDRVATNCRARPKPCTGCSPKMSTSGVPKALTTSRFHAIPTARWRSGCTGAMNKPAIGSASFHRTLKPDETNEIRLYLLGGKDRVRVTGPGEKSMLVRIITGGDSAEISDQTHCGGCTDVRQGSNPPKKPVAESTPEELKARYQPTRDWGWDLLFFPLLAFDSSRGLVIGAKGTLTTYGFELAPFANQTSVDAAYSTGTNQPRFDLATEFKTRSPLSVLGYITYSGMDQANFFGFGNETV